MRILIITNGGVGDQIQYSSLIKGLKIKHPDSEITIFCDPRLQFVYKHDKNVSDIISSLDKVEEFDLGFNFALKNNLMEIFYGSPIKERVGFIKIEKSIKATNLEAKKLMVTALGKKQSDKSLSEWFCSIAEVEWQEPYFCYETDKDFQETDVVLQYGTNVKEKNWPKEYYGDLLKYLISKKKVVCITGHEKSIKDIWELQQEVGSAFMLPGNFEKLYETAKLLSRSKLLISPDTSIVHIGITLGLKTIIISNNYDRGFAFSDKFKNLCFIKKENIEDITPQIVIDKMEEIS